MTQVGAMTVEVGVADVGVDEQYSAPGPCLLMATGRARNAWLFGSLEAGEGLRVDIYPQRWKRY